ncbi:hypothetical protein ACHAXT_013224 [Thalassiosira profunda]
MADKEWEIPLGLTRECAISLLSDSSDDDDEKISGGGLRSSGAASGGASDKRSGGGRGGGAHAISSYFQKQSCRRAAPGNKGGCSRVAASNSSDGPSTTANAQSIEGEADTNESQKMVANEAIAQTTKVCGEDETSCTNREEEGAREEDDVDVAAEEEGVAGAEISCTSREEEGAPEEDDPDVANGEEEAAEDEKNNPFAAFAFVAGEASSSTSWRPKKRHKDDKMQEAKGQAKHKAQSRTSTTNKTTGNDRNNKAPERIQRKLTPAEMIEMQKTDKAERKKLIAKWQAFSDPTAPMEQRRFQVLVAARLHAQCQEKMVTRAMERLRKHFDEKDGVEGGLTVHSLASADAEKEIASILSSVLYGNTKAKHIVQGAKDVLRKYRGEVPESIASLKEITGIGPKLAEILDIVNRRKLYS